tara:strand:+ start:96 stop:374 length:279 start_codon:yes stop_codon:yes gene_type:complete
MRLLTDDNVDGDDTVVKQVGSGVFASKAAILAVFEEAARSRGVTWLLDELIGEQLRASGGVCDYVEKLQEMKDQGVNRKTVIQWLDANLVWK